MSLKQRVPWWAKIAAKMVLSRTPARYQFWRKFSLFVHGRMDSPEYAYGVVKSHLERLGWADFAGKTVLELGPGDSLFTAVIARAFGAERVLLVDAGPFASVDVEQYRALADLLRAKGLTPPNLSAARTVADVLTDCAARYYTRGLADLREIPAASVDLVFSQAVLEHVRLAEVAPTFVELRRILRPDGVMSHQVDLKDHLASALNSLRFSTKVWEGDLMANSGFYTNRMRFTEMLRLMRDAGFRTDHVEPMRWPALPTRRAKLDRAFRDLPDDELLVSQFDVIARPA
jgi:SAM-dependent methyltransferase